MNTMIVVIFKDGTAVVPARELDLMSYVDRPDVLRIERHSVEDYKFDYPERNAQQVRVDYIGLASQNIFVRGGDNAS